MAQEIKCNICRGKGVIKTVNGFKPCQRCAMAGTRDPVKKINMTNGIPSKTETKVDLHETPTKRETRLKG